MFAATTTIHLASSLLGELSVAVEGVGGGGRQLGADLGQGVLGRKMRDFSVFFFSEWRGKGGGGGGGELFLLLSTSSSSASFSSSSATAHKEVASVVEDDDLLLLLQVEVLRVDQKLKGIRLGFIQLLLLLSLFGFTAAAVVELQSAVSLVVDGQTV